MGADIHLYVEKKVSAETVGVTDAGIGVVQAPHGESQKWVPRGKLQPNEDKDPDNYDLTNPAERAEYEAQPDEIIGPDYDIYGSRNYSVFAMLANVRNDGSLTPIDDPRGLPDDVSTEIQAASDRWDLDGHSHTYFTLRELLEVDWDGRTVHHKGWVDGENFSRWKRIGAPEEWCGSVAGGGVKHVTNDEMTNLVDQEFIRTRWNARSFDTTNSGLGALRHGMAVDGMSYYTEVEWDTTWMSDLHNFKDALLKLAKYAMDECGGDLDAVRIVAWFDN